MSNLQCGFCVDIFLHSSMSFSVSIVFSICIWYPTCTWCQLGVCFIFLDTASPIFQHHLSHRSVPYPLSFHCFVNHPSHLWSPTCTFLHISGLSLCSYFNYCSFVLISGSLLLLFRLQIFILFIFWINLLGSWKKILLEFLLGLNWIYRMILGALTALSCQVIPYKGILHY